MWLGGALSRGVQLPLQGAGLGWGVQLPLQAGRVHRSSQVQGWWPGPSCEREWTWKKD